VKVGGTYRLALPREKAYAALQDPSILGRCMPGCEGLEKVGEGEYAMKMKMVLAAVSGRFEGKVRIADPEPPTRFRLIVEGTGKIGFMKGDGLLTLGPVEGGTDVTYDGEVQVGGTIAAVGQRLLDTTAKMLIKKFFEKLGDAAMAA
jgi:carbon monoxide dehydrogenase subunit G